MGILWETSLWWEIAQLNSIVNFSYALSDKSVSTEEESWWSGREDENSR